MEKRVFVKNGSNAYKVIKTGHKYIVFVDEGVILERWYIIGEAETLEGALTFIKRHSKNDIKLVENL